MDTLRGLVRRGREPVPLSDHYLAFTLLNLGDLLLTGFYVHLGGLEVNRLAAWILGAFGLRGLAVYKLLLVLVVVGACEALYPRRPAAARRLVIAGCAVFGLVILFQLVGIFRLALG